MPLVLPTTPAPDLVVVSSDGVRYAVHSARLASQSAFFKDMLEIADPANLPTEPVAFAEPSSVVEILLDLIYGDGESEALVDADADTLISVGMAADKYVVDERITRKLSSALFRPECGGKALTLHDGHCAIKTPPTGDIKEAAVGAWKRHIFDRFAREQWRLYLSTSNIQRGDCNPKLASAPRSAQADHDGVEPRF